MKRMLCLWVTLLTMVYAANLYGYTIADNYWGANDHGYQDIVGEASLFDISKMDVSFDGVKLTVDIYSRYFDNIHSFDTQLGDLFISTNGWTPFGSSPYLLDNMTNGGELWEFALVLDNHLAASGNASLYKISDGAIVPSYAPSGYIWRDGQEVLFNPTRASIATGSWAIHNSGTPSDEDDYLRFIISYNNWGITGNTIGFHWAMTCANDTIEGGAPIPEPATLFLLGSGLIGLAGYARKKIKK